MTDSEDGVLVFGPITLEPESVCPACGGEELAYIGTLGNLAHLRCRACGITYSIRTEVNR